MSIPKTTMYSKELRETVNAYKRKLDKIQPLLDYMYEEDIKEYRQIIYTLMGNLQALELIRQKLLKREARVVKQEGTTLIVE